MIHLERLGVLLEPPGGSSGPIAKFNPGMVLEGDAVHMLYRYGEKAPQPGWYTDLSDPANPQRYSYTLYLRNDIRYARLSPDGKLLEDNERPVIFPTLPWESGGCEDARIVLFEGAYYIFYCAWDLVKPRAAVARTTDFVNYEKIGIIDNFTADKDHYIFPERIRGKIAFVHRIMPDIQVDYFDSFEQLVAPESWIDYQTRVQQSVILRSAFPHWEGAKVGGSAPPIRTEAGWLFTYHGVGKDTYYHMGVALLAADDPGHVLARLPYPILSPEMPYELEGDYQGCVFPVGAYVYQGDLYVSYGAGDKRVALGRLSLDALLAELVRHPV